MFFWEHKAWAEGYIVAMLENSPVELPRRIATARAEISARAAVLVHNKIPSRELEPDSLDNVVTDLNLLMEQEPAQQPLKDDYEANLQNEARRYTSRGIEHLSVSGVQASQAFG